LLASAVASEARSCAGASGPERLAAMPPSAVEGSFCPGAGVVDAGLGAGAVSTGAVVSSDGGSASAGRFSAPQAARATVHESVSRAVLNFMRRSFDGAGDMFTPVAGERREHRRSRGLDRPRARVGG